MKKSLDELLEVDQLAIASGQLLFNVCKAQLFPCDILVLSALNRGLSLSHDFALLLQNSGFMTSVAVLRLQLDNALRIHGVLSCSDPHETAQKVINRIALGKLKNSKGELMQDKTLVDSYSASKPWVKKIYKHASGYIHLSEQHIVHMVERSPVGGDGHRVMSIGYDDEYVSLQSKVDLAQDFICVTNLVVEEAVEWCRVRNDVATNTVLKERWKTPV